MHIGSLFLGFSNAWYASESISFCSFKCLSASQESLTSLSENQPKPGCRLESMAIRVRVKSLRKAWTFRIKPPRMPNGVALTTSPREKVLGWGVKGFEQSMTEPQRTCGDVEDLPSTVCVAWNVGILPHSANPVRVLHHVINKSADHPPPHISLRRSTNYSTFHFSPNPPPSPARDISTVHTESVKKILLQRHQI